MSQRTDSIRNLLPALLAAREAFLKLLKDNVNPYFSTDGRIARYADLAGVHEACEPALRKNGLCVLQTTFLSEGTLTLLTTLAHTSGEWISSEYPIAKDFGKPQSVGAALTYGRRYSYMSIVGIAAEDDDGETASGRGGAQFSRPAPPARPPSKNGTNGVHKPPAAPAAPTPAPKPAAPAPAPATAASLLAVGNFAVVTGPGIRRWARETERVRGPGIAAYIAQRAAKLGWDPNSNHWTREQIEDAHLDARDNLEMVYDAYRDEPAADHDFPADCGSKND